MSLPEFFVASKKAFKPSYILKCYTKVVTGVANKI